jgi:hypothetical protein
MTLDAVRMKVVRIVKYVKSVRLMDKKFIVAILSFY